MRQLRRQEDYYATLQIPRNSTPLQIKSAYRRLALKYHPDKSPGMQSHFQAISHAHTILSNPQKRQIYDKYGAVGLHLWDNVTNNATVIDLMLDTGRMRIVYVGLLSLLLGVCLVPIALALKAAAVLRKSCLLLLTPLWILYGVVFVALLLCLRIARARLDGEDGNDDDDACSEMEKGQQSKKRPNNSSQENRAALLLASLIVFGAFSIVCGQSILLVLKIDGVLGGASLSWWIVLLPWLVVEGVLLLWGGLVAVLIALKFDRASDDNSRQPADIAQKSSNVSEAATDNHNDDSRIYSMWVSTRWSLMRSLFAYLLILKLTGVLTFAWTWVFSPLYLTLVLSPAIDTFRDGGTKLQNAQIEYNNEYSKRSSNTRVQDDEQIPLAPTTIFILQYTLYISFCSILLISLAMLNLKLSHDAFIGWHIAFLPVYFVFGVLFVICFVAGIVGYFLLPSFDDISREVMGEGGDDDAGLLAWMFGAGQIKKRMCVNMEKYIGHGRCFDFAKLSADIGLSSDSVEYSAYLDGHLDTLAHLKRHFHIPRQKNNDEKEAIYFAGMSLGLQPKCCQQLVMEELQTWAQLGVRGHQEHPQNRSWLSDAELACNRLLCPLLGVDDEEDVAVMGSLTCNLHLLLTAFYQPTESRHKIIIESNAFPSDFYAAQSQIEMRGFDHAKSLICISSERDGIIHDKAILETINEHADSIAIILLPAVQYQTGQLLDIPQICKGALVGIDCAHAVGNVPLSLPAWGVDFATWCSYKYLNSGPGGISGLFVHSRHRDRDDLCVLRGWWGHQAQTRFQMNNRLEKIRGARGFRQSNPCILAMTALLASLQVFSLTNMAEIRNKSTMLSQYFRHLYDANLTRFGKIITPPDVGKSGAQISILINDSIDVDKVEKESLDHGLFIDSRQPSIIRLAPIALYNTFADIQQSIQILKTVLETANPGTSKNN